MPALRSCGSFSKSEKAAFSSLEYKWLCGSRRGENSFLSLHFFYLPKMTGQGEGGGE